MKMLTTVHMVKDGLTTDEYRTRYNFRCDDSFVSQHVLGLRRKSMLEKESWKTGDLSRLNCRFGVKIATPESVVYGLPTPLVAARTPYGIATGFA